MTDREIEFSGRIVMSDDSTEITLKLARFSFAEPPVEPEVPVEPEQPPVEPQPEPEQPDPTKGEGTLLDLRAVTEATTLTADVAGLAGGATIHVSDIAQKRGWATGAVYMLETDAEGDLVLEQDERDRKFFVTAGDHGLTRERIAELEGIPLT